MTGDPERSRDRLSKLNRLLCWALPVAAFGAGADLSQWFSCLNEPLPPSGPSLAEMMQPLPEVPAAGFPETLFARPPAPVPAPAPAARPAAPVVAPESKWRLRGVMMGPAKRAFLEDESGKSAWVAEGEQIGSARVKEIRERSVVMEGAEGDYEIRM